MGSVSMMTDQEAVFADRAQAAAILAVQLGEYRRRKNLIILGIPRGGVLLADKIARTLRGDIDVVLSRKIRAPHNRELAVGAVTEAGKLYLNQPIVEAISLSEQYIEQEKNYQLREIGRRKDHYRAKLEKRSLNGKIVILTDDGVATGATMQAAIWAVKEESPEKLILAVPVAPPDTLERLANDVDEVVCLCATRNFMAISQFYTAFEQVNDEQVLQILKHYSKVKTHG